MARSAGRHAAIRAPRSRPSRVRWRGWRALLPALFAAQFAVAATVSPAFAAASPAELDASTVDRILALDPDHLTARDVNEVLALAPAPRIIALQGSLAPVTMQPFAEFLIAMGYPAARLANPRDGSLSYSSFGKSEVLAGTLAWEYEREGMMPMLIGHSQGGLLALKTLHELAGAFSAAIPVWNPLIDAAEPRTSIVDPATGREQPVVGLRVPYVAVLATGLLPRLLLGQWTMIPKLRKVPDTVEEFTGFAIPWDPIAGTFAHPEPYAATGSAAVRNVLLPASYSHIGLPRAAHLAANPATRAWIDAWTPATDPVSAPDAAAADTANLLHAADIWYSVKRQWCREAQRVLRAARERKP